MCITEGIPQVRGGFKWRLSAPVVGGDHERTEQATANWLQLPLLPSPQHLLTHVFLPSKDFRPVPVHHSLP